MTSAARSLSVPGLAAALAGGALLALGMTVDLRLHDRAQHALMGELLPRCAQAVADQQAREDANPWHRTVVSGEALLVLGLGGLYWSERARRKAGERESG